MVCTLMEAGRDELYLLPDMSCSNAILAAGTKGKHTTAHCTESPIYVFPEKELRGLSPNSYIHVSVSDLYVRRICSHIWLQQNRQIDPGNI